MVMDLWTHVDLVCLPHCGLIALLIQVCVFLKLNAKEKAVCWFCGCEEDDDVELGVSHTCVERHIGLHIIITLFLFFYFFLTYVII